jgi:hypothetical protein
MCATHMGASTPLEFTSAKEEKESKAFVFVHGSVEEAVEAARRRIGAVRSRDASAAMGPGVVAASGAAGSGGEGGPRGAGGENGCPCRVGNQCLLCCD